MGETPDEMADRLALIALQLANEVRDDNPEAVGQWLQSVLPEPADWFRLAFVLAAAVPLDRTWSELTSWAHPDPSRRLTSPLARAACGTPRGAGLHRRNQEQLCPPCRAADNKQRRAAKARRQAETRTDNAA